MLYDAYLYCICRKSLLLLRHNNDFGYIFFKAAFYLIIIGDIKILPQLIEQNKVRGEKLASDLPILQQTTTGVWKKEDELKERKSEVAALERKIAISLKPVEQGSDAPSQDGAKQGKLQDDKPLVISRENKVTVARAKI